MHITADLRRENESVHPIHAMVLQYVVLFFLDICMICKALVLLPLPFSRLLTTIETLLKCRHTAVGTYSICVGYVQLVAGTSLEKTTSSSTGHEG